MVKVCVYYMWSAVYTQVIIRSVEQPIHPAAPHALCSCPFIQLPSTQGSDPMYLHSNAGKKDLLESMWTSQVSQGGLKCMRAGILILWACEGGRGVGGGGREEIPSCMYIRLELCSEIYVYIPNSSWVQMSQRKSILPYGMNNSNYEQFQLWTLSTLSFSTPTWSLTNPSPWLESCDNVSVHCSLSRYSVGRSIQYRTLGRPCSR